MIFGFDKEFYYHQCIRLKPQIACSTDEVDGTYLERK